MDLNRAMHKKHGELINVANEQEAAAIKAVKDQYVVMRLGIDETFGIQRDAVPDLGTDDDVPMTASDSALGATS
jgi:hypothetical protein